MEAAVEVGMMAMMKTVVVVVVVMMMIDGSGGGDGDDGVMRMTTYGMDLQFKMSSESCNSSSLPSFCFIYKM